jgi:hypothetical protein
MILMWYETLTVRKQWQTTEYKMSLCLLIRTMQNTGTISLFTHSSVGMERGAHLSDVYGAMIRVSEKSINLTILSISEFCQSPLSPADSLVTFH